MVGGLKENQDDAKTKETRNHMIKPRDINSVEDLGVLTLLIFFSISMVVKCVTCKRNFTHIHALKSHQPKCQGRPNEGFGKQKTSGRKLSQRIDVTEEEILLERQVLRDREELDTLRKRKNRHKVNFQF